MKVVQSKITQQQLSVRARTAPVVHRIRRVDRGVCPDARECAQIHARREQPARCDIRVTIALAMVAGLSVPVPRRWTSRPRGPAPDWRMQRRRMNIMKIFARGIRLRMIADMRRVLDSSTEWSRAKARLPKGMKIAGLVMTRAPVMMLGGFSLSPATETPDTS